MNSTKENVIMSYKTLLGHAIIANPNAVPLEAHSSDGLISFKIAKHSNRLLELYDLSGKAVQGLTDFNYQITGGRVKIDLDELAQLIVIDDLIITD